MKKVKWEYCWANMFIGEPPETILNRLGRDGWELVSVDNKIAYFKRPLEIEHTDPAYVDTAQLEKLVTRVIGREFGLSRK